MDVVSVASVAESLERHGERFCAKLFLLGELTDTAGPARPARLAARLAAKEAVMKALRPAADPPGWRDIEVRSLPGGAPALLLHGRAAEIAESAGVIEWSVSLAHEGPVAVAVALAVGGRPPHPTFTPPAPVREPIEGRPASMRTCDPSLPLPHVPRSPIMEDVIRTILSTQGKLDVDAFGIGEDEDLYRSGLTSHATVNVMLALEDEYDVEFPDRLLRKQTFESVAAIRKALVEIGLK